MYIKVSNNIWAGSKSKLMNLSGKDFKDIITGIFVKISTLLSQLILVPLFINTLGVELYGEWLIITTIPNYLLVSDLGLTVTVTNIMCQQISLDKKSEANELFKSTNSLIILISIVIFVAYFIASYFLDISHYLSLSILKSNYVETVLYIFIVNVCLSLLLNFNLGYFKALNKYHINQKYISILYFSDFLGTMFILLLKGELLYVPIYLAVNRVVILLVSRYELSKYPFYTYGFSSNIHLARAVIPSSINYTLYNIGFALLLQGNTFIVGKYLGSVEVVTFNTVRTMVNSVKAFISIIYLPYLPKFTISLTKSDYTTAKKDYNRLLIITVLISSLAALILYFLKEPLFYLWLHKNIIFEQVFIITMLISIMFQSTWNAASMLLLSINKTRPLLVFPVMCLVSILIQIKLLPVYGLTITSVSLLIVDVLMLYFVNSIISKMLMYKQEYL